MTGQGGRVTVVVGVDPVTVDITRESGGSPTVYSDEARTTALTMPHRAADTTSFYLAKDDTYVVSCKVRGVECANSPDGTRTVRLEGGTGITFVPSADSTRVGVGSVLAHKSIDLTGYDPPTYTSSTAALVTPEHEVTFVVPDSGWIKVSLSGLGWVSGSGVKENWCVLNDGEKLLRSEMTVIANTPAQYATYELITDMANQTEKLIPGEEVTLGWGWTVPLDGTAGTISFDNSVSSITVEAATQPDDPSTAPGYDHEPLTTVENVATVGTSAGASVDASWDAQPEEGDLLLAVFMANVVTGSWVLPDGWALARGIRVGTATARYVGLCYKIAGASEPTDLTFTGTAATLCTVHMWSKRGFTTAPTVELTEAASYDNYTSGNFLTASSTVSPTKYAVGVMGQGSGTAITNVGNGFDAVYNDGAVVRATAASEKVTHVTGKPRLKPAMASSQTVGVALVVFTGV